MELKAGSRWRSAVCDTEVVVVRAPSSTPTLECGGQPMIAHDAERPEGATVDDAFAGGTQMGKRFADAETGIEVLATKGGAGSLSLDGQPLLLKDAKPLPSSD
jgi:hypothetical protein